MPEAAACCPRCDAERVPGPECPHCGVIYAKAEARAAEAAAFERLHGEPAGPLEATATVEAEPETPDPHELVLRAAAIPAALLVAWLALYSDGLRMLGSIFMSMWLHELGHATTAWLAGFYALPGPWATHIGSARSVPMALMVTAAIVALGFHGLRRRQTVFVVAAGILLVLQIAFTLGISADTANMLITFGGDAGALVIATVLMVTIYAHPASKLRTGWLCWGFLVIGAVSFADVLHTWVAARGDFGEIPFGRIDRVGYSDATRLVETWHWDERDLIARHLRVAWLCGLGLLATWSWGLWQVWPGRAGRAGRQAAALLVAGLLLFPGRAAEASVVSPLGGIFLHDPLTFDAGVLQRGGSLRGGTGTEGFLLDAGVDLPLFHDLSFRLGYAARLPEGGHDLTWRIRLPILERARFGHLGSVQVQYAGNHPFALPDPRAPRHEVSGAYSGSFARSGPGISVHGQIGLVARHRADADDTLLLGRFGLIARAAFLTQIHRPRFGSRWTLTVSVAEITAVQFGVPGEHPGDGRLRFALAAPAVHFTPRTATYSLGLVPAGAWTWGEGDGRLHWGAYLSVAATYRTHTE